MCRYDGGRRPQAGDKIDVFKQFVIDCYERQMFKSSTPFVPPEKKQSTADSPNRSSPAPSVRRSSGPSKNSGLIKATRSTASTAPAVDLLDMGSPSQVVGNASAGNADFFNQPIAAPADLFSAFSSSNTSQRQQQPSVFGGNDFFSQPAPAAMPQQQDFFMQPQQSQQFDAFPQSTPQKTAAPFDSFQPQQQDQQMPQSIFQIQTTRPTQESDFGGFESAVAPTKPKTEDKFSSFGGLVDLGNLTSKSEEEAKKQAAMASGSSMSTNSFSGLDGFSRSPSSGSIMGFSAMQSKPSNQQSTMGLMSQQQRPPMMSNGMNNSIPMQPQPMTGMMGMMSQQSPMMNSGGMMSGNSMMSGGGMMNSGGMMNGGGMMNNGMLQSYAQQQPTMMGGMSNGMSVNTMNMIPSVNSMNNGSMGGLPSPSSMKNQQFQQGMMMQQQKNNSFDGLRW